MYMCYKVYNNIRLCGELSYDYDSVFINKLIQEVMYSENCIMVGIILCYKKNFIKFSIT